MVNNDTPVAREKQMASDPKRKHRERFFGIIVVLPTIVFTSSFGFAASFSFQVDTPDRKSAGDPRQQPAAGLSADSAAGLDIVVTTNGVPTSATISVTNEATLVPYQSGWQGTSPTGGQSSITVTGSQIVPRGNNEYILALLQAPDILKTGLDGSLPTQGQPIVATINIPNIGMGTTQVTLYPPPVIFVHGLWGSSSSLSNVQSYLAGSSPWSGLPSGFLTPIGYDGSAAFDSSATQNVLSTAISQTISNLSGQQIVAGRVDIVAHSMGGLVARSYSSNGSYTEAPRRRAEPLVRSTRL